MRNQQEELEAAIVRVKALVPIGENPQDYLAQHLDLQIEALSPNVSMGVIPSSLLSKSKLYASARIAVELINRPDVLVGKPEGIVDLGTIEWLLRPALRIRDGLLEDVGSGPWHGMPTDIVKQQEKVVCRLDVVMPGYQPIHVGTGFVATDDECAGMVMTNAHVVEAAIRLGWTIMEGVQFGCDFERYTPGYAERLIFLDNRYRLHPEYDLALLYFNPDGESIPQVDALTISHNAPDPTIGIDVGILGHPSFDSRLDSFPKYFGFGEEFGIKRFSPGKIRAVEQRYWRSKDIRTILHDATTLSGSSGSCILDLRTKEVIGLHFGGWPLASTAAKSFGNDLTAQLFSENGAVPLWHLSADFLNQSWLRLC